MACNPFPPFMHRYLFSSLCLYICTFILSTRAFTITTYGLPFQTVLDERPHVLNLNLLD